MARVLQKILAVADVEVALSERKSKITGYLTSFSDLLNSQDYHGCLRHVSAIVNELEPQFANSTGPNTLVDLLLARSALNFKLGHYDDCFSDAQKALRRDRSSLVAFHLSFLALKELNELVKALGYLCKCFSLASSRQKTDQYEDEVENNASNSSNRVDHGLSMHGDTLDIISQANLTDSKHLRMSTLRVELFHFALRTIQHVPDALDAANSAVAPTDLPGVLTGIASNLSMKSQYELSAYCLEAVIVLCKKASSDVKPTLLCALENLANVYSSINMHERALATLARFQTLATEMEKWSSVATASNLQASAHKALGDVARCEQCLQDRMDVMRTHMTESRETQFDLVNTELHLAEICQAQRHMHAAVGHAEVALTLSRQLSDRPLLIKCHLRLGRLRLLLGLYPQALFHFKTSLTVSRRARSIADQGWCLLGLVEIYSGLQRYNSVIEYCKTLLALPSPTSTASASEQGEEQAEADESTGVVCHECRCKTLLLLSSAHQTNEELDRAAALVEEARSEAEIMGDSNLLGYVNCAAGAISADIGTFMTSYKHLSAAMELAKSTSDRVLQMHCNYRMGVTKSLGGIKQQPSAVEHLYLAINQFSELRQDYGSFSEDGSKTVDLPLDCFEYLQEVLVSRGDVKEAFVVAEHTQQRIYLEMVGIHQDLEDLQGIRSVPLKMPSLSDMSRRVAASGSGVLLYSMVHNSLYMWLCLPPRGLTAGVFAFHKWPPGAVRYLAPFLRQNYFLLSRLPSTARDAARTCEARSCCLVGGEAMMYRSAAAGQLVDGQGDPPPYCPYGSIAQRQHLPYPWVGDDDLVHPGRSSYLSAPAPLDDSSIIGTESRASMRDLYDILTMPFERYLFALGPLPVKDIAIISQNGILLCPFSALVTSRRVVVCDFYQFRFQPSLLPPQLHNPKMCEQCKSQASEGVVALIAGNPTVPTVKFFGQTWRPLPLPYAEREAKSLGLLLGPMITPVLGTAAQRHTLLTALPQATLIHLSLHMSWELSSLVVAPATGVAAPTEKDVLITASDIARLHLKADLVIISGGSAYCHSSRPGTGLPQPNQHNLPSHTSMMMLARAFLAAGARAVIVSLWSIPDRATDEFMFLFYEHIKRGTSVGRALRETMESVRSKRGFTEPVHWASFVHFGEDVVLDFSSVSNVPLPESVLEICRSSDAIAAASANAEGAQQSSAQSDGTRRGSGQSNNTASGNPSIGGPSLVDLDGDGSRSLSSSTHGRLVLRRNGSSFALRSVFETISSFLLTISSAVARKEEDRSAEDDKQAVLDLLGKLVKVATFSSNLLQAMPASGSSKATDTSSTGESSTGASTVNPAAAPGKPTSPAVSSSGFTDIEQLALDNEKVHSLLLCLGFVFNHNPEGDDYSLHFPVSCYFSPIHIAMLQCANALEEFLKQATADACRAFLALLPIQLLPARGLCHLLKHPEEKLNKSAGILCDLWSLPSYRHLLEIVGVYTEPAASVSDAATASSATDSVDEDQVLCREKVDASVLAPLSDLLGILTGDISMSLTPSELDALASSSAWAESIGSMSMEDGDASSHRRSNSRSNSLPNDLGLNWDLLEDGTSSVARGPSALAPQASAGVTLVPTSCVPVSRSDTALVQPPSSNANVFNVNALLRELGISLPGFDDEHGGTTSSGLPSGDSLSAATAPSVNICTSDSILPIEPTSDGCSDTTAVPVYAAKQPQTEGQGACQSISSSSLSGSDGVASLAVQDTLEQALPHSPPIPVPETSGNQTLRSTEESFESLQEADSSLSSSPPTGTPSSANRSWRTLSRIMSFESSLSGSPTTLPHQIQTHCDECRSKFNLIRWRHICNFCLRELCHTCFDTDPSSRRKDSALANRDQGICMMCWLATATSSL